LQVFDQEDIEKSIKLSDLTTPKPLVIEGDDKHHTQRWISLLKVAAYYYDNPTLDQECSTLRNVKQHYDELSAEAWRPPNAVKKGSFCLAFYQRNQALVKLTSP
jgi:hypothetical protein